MQYLRNAITNFKSYSGEFGVIAAIRIFLNNRSGPDLKKVSIKGYKHPVFYRQGTTDFPILRFILGQELTFKEPANPKLIVDAGANVGYVSVFYATRYPASKVVAIEMEQSNFDLLLKNTAPYPQIKCMHAALWDHNKGIAIADHANKDSYSVDLKPPEGKITAPSVTLTDILSMYPGSGLDLLKMDIEGAEIEILSFMKERDIQPGILVVELHERFRPGCEAALENYLSGRKYSRSKVYEYEVIDFRTASAKATPY